MQLSFATPESQGVDSAKLAGFVREFFRKPQPYIHGLLVARHGKVICEAYRDLCSPADRHQLFSLSKSFTSTAIGIAQGEGKLSVDDLLVDYFPEYLSDKVSPRMRTVRLRDLLTMRSGHKTCALFGQNYWDHHGRDGRHFADDRPWTQNILEDPLEYEPGTRFVYNTGATYLLGAVLRKATGESLTDYLRTRFFEPLGIGPDIVWDRDPEGIELGGYGLNLSVREIAAAAQVWLHYGVAPDGRRLIPEDYMREAASKLADNSMNGTPDWQAGYGFQFWQCQHGFFRGDGASGQLAVMMPSLDAILVVTAGISDMQGELDIAWEKLLPAFASEAPLPEAPAALADLRAAEREPAFDLGPDGAPWAGFAPVFFETPANDLGIVSIAASQDADGLSLDVGFDDGRTDRIEAGFRAPRSCALAHVDPRHRFAAFGKARWTKPGLAEIRLALPCSTSFFTLTLDLRGKPSFRSQTAIFFARGWKSDVTIPL